MVTEEHRGIVTWSLDGMTQGHTLQWHSFKGVVTKNIRL